MTYSIADTNRKKIYLGENPYRNLESERIRVVLAKSVQSAPFSAQNKRQLATPGDARCYHIPLLFLRLHACYRQSSPGIASFAPLYYYYYLLILLLGFY